MAPQCYCLSIAQELFTDSDNFAAQGRVDVDVTIDLFAGMQDGAMITSAEELANFQQRDLRFLAYQVHGYLARHDDMFVALFAAHVVKRDMVVLGYGLGNLFA